MGRIKGLRYEPGERAMRLFPVDTAGRESRQSNEVGR